MGLETLAIVGLTLFQADQGLKAADKNAKFQEQQAAATIRQAEENQSAMQEQSDLEQSERLKRVRAMAGSQKVSFLNSGLTLEGTPEFALEQTFKTGIDDMNLVQKNTQTRISNIRTSATMQADQYTNNASQILSNARMEAIGSLVQAGASSGVGSGSFSGSGTFGSQGPVSRTIGMGSPAAQGPMQSFGGFDIGSGLRSGA